VSYSEDEIAIFAGALLIFYRSRAHFPGAFFCRWKLWLSEDRCVC